MRDQFRLVGSTHQETPLVQDASSSRILVDLFTDIRIETVQKDVPEFVTTRYRLVIDIGDTSDESWLTVVGENEELTGWDGSIDAVECRFLHITHDDTSTNDIDCCDTCGEALHSQNRLPAGAYQIGTHAVFAFT